jgi:hypothetical protein
MNLKDYIQSEIKSVLTEDYDLDQAFNDAQPVEEGVMSELDILAKEAKDLKSFVKTVFKEFDNLPKNKETLKWLEGIYKDSTNESVNEGRKSKDDWGVRLVMAINNNVDSISQLINREKKDPKEVMSAFATPLLNSVKGVLKHNYKPHPADSSNADKLKVFIGEVNKFEKIVELLIKRPSKSGSEKLADAWRSIWNHKGGAAIGVNGQGAHADTIIESVNEAQKINPTSMKFLKGMKKIKVKGLGGYMPGVDYVYVDGDKYYFVDFEGDHMELNNTNTIKQLHKLHGNSLGESVNEEQLDEKLITFSNRAPYGQVVFMAGGAGSGKGFAIDNFIDAAGFKVRDVDEMKIAVGKLDQLGKFSIDDWFKKYASKLPEEARAHVEEFVVGKGMSISDVANNLKNPNNVAALHYIVDSMGLKDKWLINMLSGKTNKETLPNLLFDITAKKVNSITDVIKPLVDGGYDPKNIHLIWVLTDYHLAVSNNKDRKRVVPDDILLGTHEGAAKTIWGILTKGLPSGLNGRIDVILNNRENTVTYKDSKGNEMKGAVKGFLSLPVKKQGGGTLPEKVWKELLYTWISDNGPKTIDLSKPLDRQMGK